MSWRSLCLSVGSTVEFELVCQRQFGPPEGCGLDPFSWGILTGIEAG